MIGSGDVFAATSTAPTDNGISKEKLQGWLKTLNGIMAGLAGLMALMTYLVTMFLDPAWLNGSLFNMTSTFKEIWILVSNVVYFIFAFILIGIAFMNIIGKGDKWELKTALPKFIIGVIIVPFSWFFIQFILSISAIFTASVITLPADSFPDYKNSVLKQKIIPKDCKVNFGSENKTTSSATTPSNPSLLPPILPSNPASSTPAVTTPLLPTSPSPTPLSATTGVLASDVTSNGIITCYGDKMTVLDAFKSDNIEGAIFGSLAVYTYGIVNFENLGNLLSDDVIKGVNTIGDFIFKIVFDVLFVVIFAILMITLGLVLIVRGIYIWIYIMISPIFGLMYFFDKKDGDFFGKFNLKEFIALAMVPVYVMAALSFGFLFIHVVATGLYTSTGSSGNKIIKINDKGNTISIGQTKLHFKGSLASSNLKQSSVIGQQITGATDSVMGVIGGVIMQLFAIIVLWGTVMAALRTSDITKELTKPIYDFGNQVGSLAVKSPMYAPVFGGMSGQGLKQASSLVSQHYSNKSTQTGTDWFHENTNFGNNLTSDMNIVNSKHAKSVLTSTSPIKSYINAMAGKIKTANKTLSDVLANSNSKKEMDDMIHKIFGDEAYANVKNITNPKQYANALKRTSKFNNASSFGHSYFTSNIATISQDQVIEMLEGGLSLTTPTTPTTPTGGGTNSGITNVSGTYNINIGNVHARLDPVKDSSGKITLIKGDNRDLARAIQQGFKGSDLVSGLENLGLNSESDRKRILTEIGKYLVVDGTGKVVYDEHSTANSTGIDIDELLKGKIKKA